MGGWEIEKRGGGKREGERECVCVCVFAFKKIKKGRTEGKRDKTLNGRARRKRVYIECEKGRASRG